MNPMLSETNDTAVSTGSPGIPAATPMADNAASTAAPAVPESTMAMLQNQLGEILNSGGPVVSILLLMSIAALTIFLLKWWQFSRLRLDSNSAVNKSLDLWYRHEPDEALEVLASRRQPAAKLVYLALSHLHNADIDLAGLREELVRAANAELEKLRGHLRALEIIASISPLLGLLGTVLGMIEAFQQLETAGDQVDPSVLSGGIWQALLTTAVGLGVAIPTLMMHSWLERKVERCGHFMEDAVTRVFTRQFQSARPRTQHGEELVSSYAT